jgi:hypothetical protein
MVTTTENLYSQRGPLCGTCGKPAPGDLALFDGNNRPIGICCAKGSRREELLAMFGGEEPEAVVSTAMPVGHDPFNGRKNAGAHPAIGPVIEGVRRMNIIKSRLFGEYGDQSLTAEAVREAVEGGFVKQKQAEDTSYQFRISFPPAPGEDEAPAPVDLPRFAQPRDPVYAPLGAGRKKGA